jgi:hypothetical protein
VHEAVEASSHKLPSACLGWSLASPFPKRRPPPRPPLCPPPGVPYDLRVYSSSAAPDTYLYNLDGSFKYM